MAAAGAMSVSAMFVALQGALTADQDIREVGAGPGRGAGGGGQRAEPPDGILCPQEIRKVVQALEQTAREMLTLLQGVHQGAGFQDSECGRRRGRAGRVLAQLRADAAESCSVTAVRGAAAVGVCPEAFGSDFGRGETIAE